MARKKKEESSSGGCPAWLATYGDMVTLVLTFFVLLYSMSTIDTEKWKGLVIAMNGSPDIFTVIDNPSTDLGNTGLKDPPELPEDVFTNPTDEWQEFIDMIIGAAGEINENAGGITLVNVEADDLKIIVQYSSDVLFETASAVLRPEVYPAIQEAVDNFLLPGVIEGLLMRIEIQGHADIRPFQVPGQDNLGLSSDRANAVERYILSNYPEIPRTMVISSGLDDKFPVDGNYGDYNDPDREEIWRRNRRVEFILWKNVATVEDLSEDGGENTNS